MGVLMEPEIINNADRSRFEIKLDNGEFAFLDYRLKEKVIALLHTFVPKEYEGHGLAAMLAKHSLEDARARGYKVLVYCPYVATYLKRHPDYDDIVLPHRAD
jgi:uncharacterized protein